MRKEAKLDFCRHCHINSIHYKAKIVWVYDHFARPQEKEHIRQCRVVHQRVMVQGKGRWLFSKITLLCSFPSISMK
jgi:hypothetical protein